jgi:hypothetical protein
MMGVGDLCDDQSYLLMVRHAAEQDESEPCGKPLFENRPGTPMPIDVAVRTVWSDATC